MSTPDEITGTESVITSGEIEQRIWYIEHWDCGQDDPDCGDEDCPRHGTTARELTALQELHEVMQAGPFETLISHDCFPSYVQDGREQQGGIPEDIAGYIDWESYAEDQYGDYTPVTFRGTSYQAQ